MPESSKPDRRWFPLRFDLIEKPEFRSLTYSQIVALVGINAKLSEHFSLVRAGYRQGPLILPDRKMARALNMSLINFRLARRRLMQLGWIDCRPGKLGPGGRRLASEYWDAVYGCVKWGVRCAALRQSVWTRLLGSLFNETLSHQDIAACVLLLYLWELMGGPRVCRIVIPRDTIQDHTNMSPRAFLQSLRRLQTYELSGLSFDLKCKDGNVMIENLTSSVNNEAK